MQSAAVEFQNLTFTLPAAEGEVPRTLLAGITLSLAPGSMTALLGRSGSGKTTLLRSVNALVMPSAGTVCVNSKPTSEWNLRTLRRSIGYVIQESGLFPHWTVERNAGLALELRGRRERNRKQRVAEVLALTGLDPSLAERYPWQLSGGQRQRVGLARALAPDPGILLMDEPFGALDPMTRAEMQTMVKDLLARVSKTVLLVTHDLDEALYLAQRIVFLEAGRVVADLPAGEVMRSDNPHVRAYVAAVHRGAELA